MRTTYTITGIHTAINLLRPQAKYCLSNTEFIIWDDPRPAPSWEEIQETINKIRDFEDTIECVELPKKSSNANDMISTYQG